MAKLKPWYHVVTPREDLREKRALDASEFAVHLDQVREGSAPNDYRKPERFFDRTFMTRALRELCAQAVRRLSGIKLETSAVFNMATQFGGGKTHALTALYHLAKGGERAKAWKGIDTVLKDAGVAAVPEAAAAVFVGNQFDVLEGRGGNGEPKRKTPWGEIAWQLGQERSFAAVAEHDAKAIAPGGDVIRKMLPEGPCLILMDELLNYISRGRKLGLASEFFNFLQNLSEEARGRDNVVLCVSIPASDLEMNPEDQRDHDSIKKLLDRVGRAIMMSAETETAEIIKRRLFDWGGLPEDGRKAATEYADWAVENAAALSGIDPASARDVFLASYPFHPSVLSVFERKWQSLPRFQRTRGILRLLALWVQYAYEETHRRAAGDALVTLGSAPIEDPTFRSAMFEQLGSSDLEGPVTTDIAGKSDAWSIRLDREASAAIRKERLHQKVATTILFESNGGQTKKLFATLPEVRTAVGAPDVIMTDVEHVLEQLASSCYYLSQEGNQYKYSLTPNLNKLVTDRRAGVANSAIDQRVRKEIEKQFKPAPGGPAIDRRFWPARSNDVPDRPELTLVVLGTDRPAGEKATQDLMDSIVRNCGTPGRTMKSAVLFAVPEAPAGILSATRDLLAWEDIEDDADTKKQLDDGQKRQLVIGLGRAQADLKEAIWRSYRHVCLLDKSNKLRDVDFGQVTSSMATSMVELIVNELVRIEEITPIIGANRLLKDWPPANERWSTKAVRDAYFSEPRLPRLLRPESIKRTIADGVAQGLIVYAQDDGRGGLRLRDAATSLPDSDVEIADDVYILKAAAAQKFREPPRLAALRVTPPQVAIGVGEKAPFEAAGSDQYGQPFPIAATTWEATGGTIDRHGLFTAGSEPGAFTVRAQSEASECVAHVRIAAAGAPSRPSPLGTAVLRWSGSVPTQKWMNFYTKIVSKHATNPELRLKVTVEVPVERGDATVREQEARAALRELGLSEDVQVTESL